MEKDNERLAFSQWLLDRNIAWVTAADAKVGFIVAINTAMLAGLATAYHDADEVAWIGATTTVVAALLAISSVFCCAFTVLARTEGPASILFFGQIAKLSREEYRAAFRSQSLSKILDDFSGQIHRNAEIARDKFCWVRRASWLSFIAGSIWCVAIAILIAA